MRINFKFADPILGRALAGTCPSGKRPRGEKKPIPEDQKDEKYYERRKRNNQAAKKSRDARKIREDQVLFIFIATRIINSNRETTTLSRYNKFHSLCIQLNLLCK